MSKFDNSFNNSRIGFEELFSKTKNVAESLNKKSAQAIDLSKKRIEYLDTKTKLSRFYEKYGRLQFNVMMNEPIDEEELNTVVSQITAYREKLDVLKAEVEDTSEIKDTSELKREAEELRKEVKAASAEAREVFKKQMEGVYKNAKGVFKNVQNPPKAEDEPTEVTVEEVEQQE